MKCSWRSARDERAREKEKVRDEERRCKVRKDAGAQVSEVAFCVKVEDERMLVEEWMGRRRSKGKGRKELS